MFRAAAAIFARKTAIVAITGVTVIGGASLALAGVAAQQEPDDVVEVDCGDEANLEHEDCQDPEPVNCDDEANADLEDCQDPEPVDCGDEVNAEDETCLEDETELDEGEGAEENDADVDEVDGERPDNHGKVVSEAAKPGGTCGDKQGRERGQCIAEIARSNGGEQAPEGPAEEPAVEETAPEEPAAAAAPADTGKPAGVGPTQAGPPAGKGGPPAGKGKG